MKTMDPANDNTKMVKMEEEDSKVVDKKNT